MDTLSDARKRRADELAHRYDEQLKKHGFKRPDAKSTFKTAYLCAVSDLEEIIAALESEIIDLKSEMANGRVISYYDGPNVKVMRTN